MVQRKKNARQKSLTLCVFLTPWMSDRVAAFWKCNSIYTPGLAQPSVLLSASQGTRPPTLIYCSLHKHSGHI